MPYKEFSAFFNPFVSHTVKFLNRFACVCEEVCNSFWNLDLTKYSSVRMICHFESCCRTESLPDTFGYDRKDFSQYIDLTENQ